MITAEETQESTLEWGRKLHNQELYRLLTRTVKLLENIDTTHFSYYDRLMLEDLLCANNDYNQGLRWWRMRLKYNAKLEGLNYGW